MEMKLEARRGVRWRKLWTSAAFLAAASLLGASNPARAQTALFYCITITSSMPSSYILHSNLSAMHDCIVVKENGVSIDLNGFTISAAPTASGPNNNGINAAGQTDVSVRNGTVTGFSSNGILLGDDGIVQGVHANANVGNGIDCGNNCVISGNTANGNGTGSLGGSGILAGSGGKISGNTANGNHNLGILGNTSTISANTANLNGTAGILAALGSVVSGNVAHGNGTDGITTVSQTTGEELGGGALVIDNSAEGNTGFGINLSGDLTNGYQNNVASANSRGQIKGGTSLGNNLCNGSTSPC